mmetsp:Transcript_10830/g.29902  ORF Transcript_10830/g.29902 Transcript_10830/m.29902 type:complete len:261 (+) Transcript_10830:572-1354(+)
MLNGQHSTLDTAGDMSWWACLKAALARVHQAPRGLHLLAETWMIRLKLLRGLGEAHDHGVHRAQHNAHGDPGKRKPDDCAHEENDNRSIRPKTWCGPTSDAVQEHAHQSRQGADNQANEEEDSGRKVVADDGGPSSLAEQMDDLAAGGEEVVSVQPHVAKRPLVEVFGDVGNESENALHDAEQDLVATSVSPCACGRALQRADQRNQQACHADAAEGVRRCTTEAVADGWGPHMARLLRREPPSSDHSSNGNVNNILEHL